MAQADNIVNKVNKYMIIMFMAVLFVKGSWYYKTNKFWGRK